MRLVLQVEEGVSGGHAGQSQAALDLARGAAVCVVVGRLRGVENISK
jgi:hypothetical protein